MSLGIALLVSSTLGYGFEVLATSSDDWMAPGYQIEATDTISIPSPLAPILFAGRTGYGCQVSFEQVEGQEVWKMILVGDGRVAILQQGMAPEYFDFVEGPECIHISANGRYVIAESAAYSSDSDSLSRVMILDLDQGRLINTNIDLPFGSFATVISNDGRPVGISGFGVADLSSSETPRVSRTPGSHLYSPALDPNGHCLTMTDLGNLWAFDWTGAVLWSLPTGGFEGLAHAAFSPGGEFILSYLDSMIVRIDPLTGSVDRLFLGEPSHEPPVFSHSGSRWATIVRQSEETFTLRTEVISSPLESSEVTIPQIEEEAWCRLCGIADDAEIAAFFCGQPEQHRLVIAGSQGVVYVSPCFTQDLIWTNRVNSFSMAYTGGAFPVALSDDGSRWISYIGESRFAVSHASRLSD